MLSIAMNPYTAHNYSGKYTIQSEELSVPYYFLQLQMSQYQPFPYYCCLLCICM